MRNVLFTLAKDILGNTAPLDEVSLFPFQGIPIEIRSNSHTVIEDATELLGVWSRLERRLIVPMEPLRIDLVVHPGSQRESVKTPFTYRIHGDYVLAGSNSNMMMIHRNRGIALGFVTPEMVAEKDIFQSHVINSLALNLVMHSDRRPIHAGAVVRKSRPVIFIGHSGTGKSTMCYACVRRGFQLLTEDAVFISIRDGLRLWSSSQKIHLYPDARCYFPELADTIPRVSHSGKLKISVDMASPGADRYCLWAEDPIVCILQRHHHSSSNLRPILAQAVIDALCKDLESGFDLVEDVHKVAEVLAQKEKYCLTVGRDLNGAVDMLKNLTD